ncbi:MAG: 4Fe-4S binding protein [Acidobacteria bacterium]|nr:4Fe-4S binding protein [Acidobacteriota bacterium]
MTLTQIEPVRGKKPFYKSVRIIRHAVMFFFFAFLVHVAWDHQVKGGGPNGSPSVEAYCPFGGIENLYYFLTSGGYVRRIEPSAMILMAAVLLLTLLFSRGFCGWVCPFGSVQEWLGLLGRKIFRKRYNPDGVWVRRLAYLKYVLLVVIVGFTWHLGTLVWRPYDPFLAFFHLGSGMSEMPFAYAALGVVLVGSLKYERFFCRFACPLGAVIGLVGKLGLTKVTREDEGCKGCNVCRQKCFAHVEFLTRRQIRDVECNHCLECVANCPRPNVLSLKGWKWSFSHGSYAALLLLGFASMILVSKVSGHWRTKPEGVSFVNAAGQLDPDQIRGWMSPREISTGYGIPLEKLYDAARLPRNVDSNTRVNQIAKTYNIAFEPDQLREVVRGFVRPGGPARKTSSHVPGGEEPEVKGFMTLNEIVMKTGVPKQWLVERLGLSAEVDARKPVREFLHAEGKSIEDVREAVKAWRTTRP